ncbi:MAG: calcium-binding protein, partial [Agitococcus sp.]|nr:calcium-binding protein [Agitococcus sp.]
NGSDGNDVLEGGDGTDVLDGGKGADILRGGAGNDTLGGVEGGYDSGYNAYGFYSPIAGNTYEGGTGNDILRGTSMADLYLFNLGDGQDTLNEVEIYGQPAGQVDVLRFGAGIASTDVTVGRTGLDLVLSLANGTDKVTIKNWFNNTPGATNYQVERVEFADGTVWANTELTARACSTYGTAGDDALTSTLFGTYTNYLYGMEGNDTLTGSTGSDQLFGGMGQDVLNGGDGNDILSGGLDADTLNGGVGNDVYRWTVGDGSDILRDTLGLDTLDLSNLQYADARVYYDGNDLLLRSADSDQFVRIKDQLITGSAIETFLFAGTSYTAGQVVSNASDFKLLG